jgi:hypothetical protein
VEELEDLRIFLWVRHATRSGEPDRPGPNQKGPAAPEETRLAPKNIVPSGLAYELTSIGSSAQLLHSCHEPM